MEEKCFVFCKKHNRKFEIKESGQVKDSRCPDCIKEEKGKNEGAWFVPWSYGNKCGTEVISCAIWEY